MNGCRHFAHTGEGGGGGMSGKVLGIGEWRGWIYGSPQSVEEEGIENFEDDVHVVRGWRKGLIGAGWAWADEANCGNRRAIWIREAGSLWQCRERQGFE